MIAVREAVEWGCGKITHNFRLVDFEADQKVLLSSVGKLYLLTGLLANSRTCLYGSLISLIPAARTRRSRHQGWSRSLGLSYA